MTLIYFAKRFGIFLLIVWLAATLNFFLPRIGGENPVAQKVMQMAALGGNLHAGMQDMVKEYETKFGIDKPLWQQYLNYLVSMVRFDFGYSIANYPRRVGEMIAEGLPWTLSLITGTTPILFHRRQSSRAPSGLAARAALAARGIAAVATLERDSVLPARPDIWSTCSVSPFSSLPMYGGYTAGAIPQWSFSFALDVAYHAILPALAIILGSLGSWALGMRAMMVTTEGEDYVTFAEAKGRFGSHPVSSTTASATPSCRK